MKNNNLLLLDRMVSSVNFNLKLISLSIAIQSPETMFLQGRKIENVKCRYHKYV